jgi:hypothetical protein
MMTIIYFCPIRANRWLKIISELFDCKWFQEVSMIWWKSAMLPTDNGHNLKWWQRQYLPQTIFFSIRCLTGFCIYFKHNFNYSPTYSCVCNIEQWFYFEIGDHLSYGDKSSLKLLGRTDICLLQDFHKKWFSCIWMVLAQNSHWFFL